MAELHGSTDEAKNVNDIIYAVAKRARELADMKMPELREAAGFNCDTFSEARRVHADKKRGELIEYILTEEMIEEFPKDIAE